MYPKERKNMKSTLEKPIEGEWEIEFEKKFRGDCMDGFQEEAKSFIRQTILTERAKWKREMKQWSINNSTGVIKETRFILLSDLVKKLEEAETV